MFSMKRLDNTFMNRCIQEHCRWLQGILLGIQLGLNDFCVQMESNHSLWLSGSTAIDDKNIPRERGRNCPIYISIWVFYPPTMVPGDFIIDWYILAVRCIFDNRNIQRIRIVHLPKCSPELDQEQQLKGISWKVRGFDHWISGCCQSHAERMWSSDSQLHCEESERQSHAILFARSCWLWWVFDTSRGQPTSRGRPKIPQY